MDTAAKAAGILDTPDPTANPSRDIELGQHARTSQNPSRASLPLTHQRSFSVATSQYRANSLRGGRTSTARGEEVDGTAQEGEDDAEWGPSHPCYPHQNTHVPIDSPLYSSTRIIRIKRDWMIAGDLAPTFSTLYPEILEPFLAEGDFRDLVQHINSDMMNIFDPWRPRAWMDAGIGVLTGWLWDDLGMSGSKIELVRLEKWLENWSKDRAQKAQNEYVRIIPLRRTAYLCLDIQIPDPEVEPEGNDENRSTTIGFARSLSTRSKSNISRTGSQINAGKASHGTSRSPASDARADTGASHPVVPPIPGRYREEAQKQVERQMQEQQRQSQTEDMKLDPT